MRTLHRTPTMPQRSLGIPPHRHARSMGRLNITTTSRRTKTPRHQTNPTIHQPNVGPIVNKPHTHHKKKTPKPPQEPSHKTADHKAPTFSHPANKPQPPTKAQQDPKPPTKPDPQHPEHHSPKANPQVSETKHPNPQPNPPNHSSTTQEPEPSHTPNPHHEHA